MNLSKKIALSICALALIAGTQSHAAGSSGGGHGFSLGISSLSPSQDDLNSHISAVNSANSTAVGEFGTGYEFFLNYTYRISGSIFGLFFRPGYFMQSAKGSSYNYSLSGYTFYPGIRFYPLENQYIKFFLQAAVGYGRLSGKLSQPNGEVSFGGGSFGAMGGAGAEFCITDSHCLFIEGNLRYNPIERNIVSKASGTPTQLSQTASDNELEYNNSDVKTSLSGIQGVFGYTMWF